MDSLAQDPGFQAPEQAPVFPAGSRNIGGSRFLVVPDAVSWEQASATAKAAGGHLAVPSTDVEAAWMAEELRRSLHPNEAAWTGGLRMPAAAWGFVTGERFDSVTWAPGQPDDMDDAPAYLQFLLIPSFAVITAIRRKKCGAPLSERPAVMAWNSIGDHLLRKSSCPP